MGFDDFRLAVSVWNEPYSVMYFARKNLCKSVSVCLCQFQKPCWVGACGNQLPQAPYGIFAGFVGVLANLVYRFCPFGVVFLSVSRRRLFPAR